MLLLLLLLVRLLVILLAGVLVVRGLLLVLVVVGRRDGAQIGGTTSEINVDTTGVFLGGVLQAHLATDLFDTGLDFLDVVCGVVSFADDAVPLVCISYFVLLQQARLGELIEGKKRTHEDGSAHATWRT